MFDDLSTTQIAPPAEGEGIKTDAVPKKLAEPANPNDASKSEVTKHRHHVLMDLLDYEAERQSEERIQMQIDEDYYDHLQWRPDDARELMERGQAPLVFNEARQTID